MLLTVSARFGSLHLLSINQTVWQGDFAGAAGDADDAVLQRLAQDLEGGAFELGQFIEEEHAVVREGDFTGAGDGAAAEQADVGDGVVRGAHGAASENVALAERLAGGGVDGEDLQRLFQGGVGHDRGHAFGDHGFARARGADHDEVVSAGDGDLDGAAQRVLALDLGKVAGALVLGALEGDGLFVRVGGDVAFAGEEAHGFVERAHGVHGDAFDEGSLGRGVGGDDQAAAAERAGELGHGEGAAHGAGAAGEAEFAGDEVVVDRSGLDLAGGDEDADRDGQVVERAFLAQGAGGEVDGGAGAGRLEAAVAEGGEDAVVGFLDGGVGQADQHEFGVADFAGIHLHVDGLGLDALQSCG